MLPRARVRARLKPDAVDRLLRLGGRGVGHEVLDRLAVVVFRDAVLADAGAVAALAVPDDLDVDPPLHGGREGLATASKTNGKCGIRGDWTIETSKHVCVFTWIVSGCVNSYTAARSRHPRPSAWARNRRSASSRPRESHARAARAASGSGISRGLMIDVQRGAPNFVTRCSLRNLPNFSA